MKRLLRKKKSNNKRNKKHSQGSITVFVTLLMIPVILLNGFIVDMGRIKLYGDQAVMVADNYGEAALTNYDNLMKEMYGLFAMAQSEEGMAAIKQINEIVGYSAFDPNKNTILGNQYEGFLPYSSAEIKMTCNGIPESSLENDPVLQTQIGDFMRFRIIQESVQAMNGNSLEDAEKLTKALETSMNTEKDADVIDRKIDLDETISDIYEDLYRYYLFAYGYRLYPDDLTYVNNNLINPAVYDIKHLYDSDYVKKYYDYVKDNGNNRVAEAIPIVEKVRELTKRIEELEKNEPDQVKEKEKWEEWKDELDGCKKELEKWDDEKNMWQNKNNGWDMDALYDNWHDYDAVKEREKIEDNCDKIKKELEDNKESYIVEKTISRENAQLLKDNGVQVPTDPKKLGMLLEDIYDHSGTFTDVAINLNTDISKYNECKANLETALSRDGVDQTFEDNIRINIQAVEELIGLINNGKGYTQADFKGLTDCVESNKQLDMDYSKQYDNLVQKIEDIKINILNGNEIPELKNANSFGDFQKASRLDETKYMDFQMNAHYKALWEMLDEKFGKMNSAEEEKFRKRENEANDEAKKYTNDMKNESVPEARDVPAGFTLSSTSSNIDSGIDPLGALKNVAKLFRGTMSGAATELLLNYYVISYDFGMFTSRINAEIDKKIANGEEVDEDKIDVNRESLTGFIYDKNSDYMYGAELEYIFAGYKCAKDNLNTARNMIVGFRMVMNFKSTYTISEINDALKAVQSAGNAIFPGLGYIIEAALRLVIATVESCLDWNALKAGESVLIDKKSLTDLMIIKKSTGLLDSIFQGKEKDSLKNSGDATGEKGGIELTYNQYLRILILLMDTNDMVLARTGDLITLNMNLVSQYHELGEDGILKKQTFSLNEAYTAVESTCSVRLGFAVMPEGFLYTVMDEDVADDISAYGKGYFNYTVIRGY